MDESEKLAFEYLSSRGFDQIEYEPDGKVTPDFLVNGKIAIEVRRLHYHYCNPDGSFEDVDTAEIAVIRAVKSCLATLGPSNGAQSWFVCVSFHRPLPPFQTLTKRLIRVLSDIGDNPQEDARIAILPNFHLKLIRASQPQPDRFLLGASSDFDEGGWLGAELQRNTQIAIDQKTEKLSKRRHCYPEWWLILIDHIGYGIREPFSVNHTWDKVILVNPHNPAQAYEV